MPSHQQPNEPPKRELWVDLLVLIPAAAGALAVLRIYAFAGGDPATMKFLGQTLNLYGLLVSALAPILAISLMCFAILALAVLTLYPSAQLPAGSPLANPSRLNLYRVACSMVVLQLGLVVPLLFALGAAFVGIAISSTVIFARRRGEDFPDPLIYLQKFIRYISIPILIIVPIGLSLTPQSWIPAETARIGNSLSPTVIYVLDMKEGQATILDRSTGRAQVLPVDQLHGRQGCNDESMAWYTRPLRHFLGEGKRQPFSSPDCPPDRELRPTKAPAPSLGPPTVQSTAPLDHSSPGQSGSATGTPKARD